VSGGGGGAGSPHLKLSHTPLAQSELALHVFPNVQGRPAEPPQSMSVSSPFRTPSAFVDG
jgi:hypothetical protein